MVPCCCPDPAETTFDSLPSSGVKAKGTESELPPEKSNSCTEVSHDCEYMSGYVPPTLAKNVSDVGDEEVVPK